MRLIALVVLSGCVGMADGPPQPDSGSSDSGSPPSDAGNRTDAGAMDSGTPDAGASDSGTPDSGLPLCPPDAGLNATGTTHELMSGQTLQQAIGAAAPGDRIHVSANLPMQTVTAAPSADVFIEADNGVQIAGLDCNGCAHLVLRGMTFTNTVNLQPGTYITLDRISLDMGTQDATALYIHGNGDVPANASHHITVSASSIHGGARTIFILTNFSPSTNWNHDLVFVGNDFQCGSHNCFQFSGGADARIEANLFHDPGGDGVLTAGATRIQILRNQMLGTKTVMSDAVAIASPGMEWDNYAGVENMISSDITVANNVMVDWGHAAVDLEAATNIRVVYNTVVNTTGFTTWARVPHDQSGNVILMGNSDFKLWNNIFPSMTPDSADPAPTLNVSNLVGVDPKLANSMTGELSPQSPAIDMATINADTPLVDFKNLPRGPMPDIGAQELGATAACR
jgi:hypothetical protein